MKKKSRACAVRAENSFIVIRVEVLIIFYYFLLFFFDFLSERAGALLSAQVDKDRGALQLRRTSVVTLGY